MEWTKKDKHLFTIVNQSGKYHLERQIQDASEKYFTLTKSPSFHIIFGFYNTETDTFCWENKMNELSYNTVKKEHIDVFGSMYTLKKLFKPIVKFDKEYANIIPYLMEALNEDYNVVRVKSHNCYFYALTKVEGIHRSFNYTIFEEALIYYRNEEETHNRKRNYTVKKREGDEFECKEKLV